ncbi:MAG TPA: hypothetical protein VLA56_17635, partial [Pseudomonadales bacterium]|nr:hypothetical protein [Pseudomonadales bacterium]
MNDTHQQHEKSTTVVEAADRAGEDPARLTVESAFRLGLYTAAVVASEAAAGTTDRRLAEHLEGDACRNLARLRQAVA